MAVKGILQPKITVAGMPGFLLWARTGSPALYRALVARFPAVAEFEEAVSADDRPGGMGGVMDILSTIGNGISSAASSISSFVANNGATIFSAAGGYLIAQQQAKLANTQLQLAQASRPPVQTAMVTLPSGQQVSVPVQPTGTGAATYATYSATPQTGGVMATLASVPLTTWLLGAGALAGVLLLVKRR